MKDEPTEGEEVKELMKTLADWEKKMGSLRNKAQSLIAHLAAVFVADPTDEVTKAIHTEMTAKSAAFSEAYMSHATSVATLTRGTRRSADEIQTIIGKGSCHYKAFQDTDLLMEANNACATFANNDDLT